MKKEIGQRVWCNGYEGTIVAICEWAPTMVEVELARGIVCVSFNDLERFNVYD